MAKNTFIMRMKKREEGENPSIREENCVSAQDRRVQRLFTAQHEILFF